MGAEIAEVSTLSDVELHDVTQPIERDPKGKNLLSMHQLLIGDIDDYIEDAYKAERAIKDPSQNGVNILPRVVLKAVMRQPSTRTGGSMTTAMSKLGGSAELISGMESSSEAKGETLADSWVAFATQSDILGTRTSDELGPMYAAHCISQAVNYGQLARTIPVINLGDGRNEHPTQALGDMFTIHKYFHEFSGLIVAIVGDHERYRAHHSFMIGAAILGINVIAVESPAAPVPKDIKELFGKNLSTVQDLDEAMKDANVLYMGRNPDEYTGKDSFETERSRQLAHDYDDWTIDSERLQNMPPSGIVMHPRPRKGELNPNVDSDLRMKDVEQMENMIPMRMAIIARHLGKTMPDIVKH